MKNWIFFVFFAMALISQEMETRKTGLFMLSFMINSGHFNFAPDRFRILQIFLFPLKFCTKIPKFHEKSNSAHRLKTTEYTFLFTQFCYHINWNLFFMSREKTIACFFFASCLIVICQRIVSIYRIESIR